MVKVAPKPVSSTARGSSGTHVQCPLLLLSVLPSSQFLATVGTYRRLAARPPSEVYSVAKESGGGQSLRRGSSSESATPDLPTANRDRDLEVEEGVRKWGLWLSNPEKAVEDLFTIEEETAEDRDGSGSRRSGKSSRGSISTGGSLKNILFGQVGHRGQVLIEDEDSDIEGEDTMQQE